MVLSLETSYAEGAQGATRPGLVNAPAELEAPDSFSEFLVLWPPQLFMVLTPDLFAAQVYTRYVGEIHYTTTSPFPTRLTEEVPTDYSRFLSLVWTQRHY